MKRAVIIVMDSLGIGELPDAEKYGDKGSNTLGNIMRTNPDLKLETLEKLGLGNIENVDGIKPVPEPMGNYGRMAEVSVGKDTTTGHWEIAGLRLDKPFPVYPKGFPDEIIGQFEKEVGRKVLGNKSASGTKIIHELGRQHNETGRPIVYTSADSVFQIAAHEEKIPLTELYEMCRKARKILKGDFAVARVIARPFIGEDGNYERTPNRRDFSLEPPGKTLLDNIVQAKLDVKAVGKIEDIFCGRGITHSTHTSSNMDGIDKSIEYLKDKFIGLLFTNLVDFDMLYGHRNNSTGYADALHSFDERLPEILNSLLEDDILFITADHGCDPTTKSTDHSREYVPLIVYGNKISGGMNLGTRYTFSDIAATVAEYLEVKGTGRGISFLPDIMLSR